MLTLRPETSFMPGSSRTTPAAASRGNAEGEGERPTLARTSELFERAEEERCRDDVIVLAS